MRTIFFKKIENTVAIGALGIWQPDDTQLIESTEISQYAPFNHLTIYNKSDKDIEVRLYGSNISDKGVEFIPAGSILIFDDKDNIQYYRPFIYNRDTSLSVAVNQVILEVRKVI